MVTCHVVGEDHARKWMWWSIGSETSRFSEVQVVSLSSLSEIASRRSISRWIGTSIKLSYSAVFSSWKEIRCMWMMMMMMMMMMMDEWWCWCVFLHPRLLLQGPLDRWRVDPFGQVPETPGATGSPRTEYGPPALAGESDTWRFVDDSEWDMGAFTRWFEKTFLVAATSRLSCSLLGETQLIIGCCWVLSIEGLTTSWSLSGETNFMQTTWIAEHTPFSGYFIVEFYSGFQVRGFWPICHSFYMGLALVIKEFGI